jgi:hypothetical protein
MFCRSLFVLLYFFFWPLCCLFFFDIRILIAPLISSNSSFVCHEKHLYDVLLIRIKEQSKGRGAQSLPIRFKITIEIQFLINQVFEIKKSMTVYSNVMHTKFDIYVILTIIGSISLLFRH